jgi:poly(A) polymerase
MPPITPISLQGPTAESRHSTDELKHCLVKKKAFDTEEQSRKRQTTLLRVAELLNDFLRDLALDKGIPKEKAGKGHIVPFGSYRLGVNAQDGDIDVLCILPQYATPNDFFETFYESYLRYEPFVSHLVCVRDAFVPAIQLIIHGIDMDLLCVSLKMDTIDPAGIDEELKTNDIFLKLVDTTSTAARMGMIRSLNGKRVTDLLVEMLPQNSTCLDAFRLALRVIKLWAKARGIYSNILGYLGGISWAILLVHVCQLYPNADAAMLVFKFFFVYSHWNWSCPIKLREVEDFPAYPIMQWNAARCAQDRMPILTPAYPCQNSAHNVTASTFTIIQNEFKRANAFFAGVSLSHFPAHIVWDMLWKQIELFRVHKYYMIVDAYASTPPDFCTYKGIVESSLRHLVVGLEQIPGIALVRPIPDSYSSSSMFTRWFLGIRVDKQYGFKEINVTSSVLRFYSEINSKLLRANSWKEGMGCNAGQVIRRKHRVTKHKLLPPPSPPLLNQPQLSSSQNQEQEQTQKEDGPTSKRRRIGSSLQ